MFTSLFVLFCFKMMLVICAFGSVLLGTGLKASLSFRDYTQGSERQFDFFFFSLKYTLEKGWSNQMSFITW